MSDTQGVTFTFPDVPPKGVPVPGQFSRSTAKSLTEYITSKSSFTSCDTVMMTSESKNTHCPRLGNGLLGTIYTAYSSHCPLVLRPDDIFLGIVIAFGYYVTHHSEEMRSLFVDHSGRKELLVRVISPPFQTTNQSDWDAFIGLMTDEIQKNTKTDIAEWSRPTFSTTTQTDKTVAGIAMMAAVQNFFSMRFQLDCGLSKVTLQGTLEDWQLVRKKAEFLSTLGVPDLTEWARLLIPVLDQFVWAYTGKVDKNFWQRVCTNKTRGSGSQQTFRGWFLVFAPFNSKGKYILNSFDAVASSGVYAIVDDDDITSCVINVPAIVTDTYTETNYNITLSGGVYMTTYNPDSVEPSVGWAMILNKTVTVEDMRVYAATKIKGQYINDKYNINDFPMELIDIAHTVATECLFPNRSLLDFAQLCVLAYREKQVASNDMKGSLIRYVKKLRFIERWDFPSFIPHEYN